MKDSWNFVSFNRIGELQAQGDLPPGVYVLANRREQGQDVGLPSLYLTIA